MARSTLVLPAILALLVPSVAWAGGTAVVVPLVNKGVDDKVPKNVSGLISSELDFSGAFDTVKELVAAPSALNTACLGSTSCLAGIAKSAGADALITGSVAPGAKGLQVFVILYDAKKGTIAQKRTYDIGADVSAQAEAAPRVVKEMLGGTSPAAQSANENAHVTVAKDEDDEDMVLGESKPKTKFDPKASTSKSAKPSAALADEDDLLDEEPDEDIEAAREAEAAKAAAAAKARAEADRKAKEEAERKAKEEEARRAKEEAARKAKEEEARRAKEEAARKAREEEERLAREEAARKAKEESARKAKEEEQRRAAAKAEEERRAALAAEDDEEPAAAQPTRTVSSSDDLSDLEEDPEEEPAQPRRTSSSSSTSKSTSSASATPKSADESSSGGDPSDAELEAMLANFKLSGGVDSGATSTPTSPSSTSSSSRSTSAPSSSSRSSSVAEDAEADVPEDDAAAERPAEEPEDEPLDEPTPSRRASVAEEDEEPVSSRRSSRDEEEDSGSSRRSSRDESESRSSRRASADDEEEDVRASRRAAREDDEESSTRSRRGDDEKATRPHVSFTARAGYSRYDDFNFINYGGELAIPVASTGVFAVLGLEGASTNRNYSEQELAALAAQGGVSPEDIEQWNTILPFNVGVIYKATKKRVRPYGGADFTITPYTADFDVAFGARARGGCDFLLADAFGLNLDVSVGFMSGDKLEDVAPGVPNIGFLPRVAAGTVIVF